MARQPGAKQGGGREIRPNEIMKDRPGDGILWLKQYGLLRQIDEERMRQRIATSGMPAGYSWKMRNGNPSIRTVVAWCDKLGIRIQLIGKDGASL